MAGSLRRALLLPGSFGSTSGSVAQACAHSLTAHGWTTSSVDVMKLARWPMAGPGATLRLVRQVPGLYDGVHFAALRNGGTLTAGAAAMLRLGISGRLREHLDRNPAELVISAGAPAAIAASALAARYPALRHVVLCGDAAPHRLWVADHVDLYLMTVPGAGQHVLKFDPEAKVATIPPPVRPEFYRAPVQRTARIGLGVADEDRCVLLIAGTRGIRGLARIAAAMVGAGLHVIAVAGHNARLAARLRDLGRSEFGRDPAPSRLSVFGYTDRVAELMAAADLVITSPGSVCAEARIVGRPLLLLDVIPGHGRENLLSELALGGAAITPADPDLVARAALACLERPSGLREPARSLADWEKRFCGALKSIDV